MKDIRQISIDLDKFSKNVINNLVNAQQESARKIWSDVVSTAPMKTGNFISSIEVSDTSVNNGEIKTIIGSRMQVVSNEGKAYNLGFLLETGTNPHSIPNAFNWGEIYGYDSEEYKQTLKGDWHPGTKPLNFYHNALEKNKTDYYKSISKAIKEAKK